MIMTHDAISPIEMRHGEQVKLLYINGWPHVRIQGTLGYRGDGLKDALNAKLSVYVPEYKIHRRKNLWSVHDPETDEEIEFYDGITLALSTYDEHFWNGGQYDSTDTD